MYEELIRALRCISTRDSARDICKCCVDYLHSKYRQINIAGEAADAIEALQAEIDRMRKYLSGRARFLECENLQEELKQVKRERDAAIDDMGYIANKIAGCDEKLDRGDNVKDLNLGRCDVCKGQCHEDKPCKFEWRGVRED